MERWEPTKPFPILKGKLIKTIPWYIAMKAYKSYAEQHGGSGQSLERVAERGGFAESELDMLYPEWRDQFEGFLIGQSTALRGEIFNV